MLFVASFLVIEIFTSIAHDAIHGNQPPPVNNTVRSRNLMVIKQGRFKTGPVLESILRSVYLSLFMASLPEVFLSERRDLLRRVYRLCDKPTTMPAVVFGITALPSSRPLDVGRWKCMGMTNVAIRAKFIHCTLLTNSATTLLDSAIGILGLMEETLRM